MNHKVKRKWVAALRGGTYRQCYGALQREDKRCALGVLLEVEPGLSDYGAMIDYGVDYDQYIFLNKMVVHMNDVKRKTFLEIADWIEQNVKETPSLDSIGTGLHDASAPQCFSGL